MTGPKSLEPTEVALAAARARLAPLVDPRATEPLVALPVPRPGQRTAVLVGPGVVRTGNVAGLRAFAAMTGLSIVNTYGAKGVFRWDDLHHAGTAGLQRDDWALAGLLDADLVVTSGLDHAECRGLDLSGCDVLDVPPSHLQFAAGGWPPPAAEPVRPELYAALASVVGPLYDVQGSPPWRARQLAGRGRVFADAGPVGFWVARTFPTTDPGSVVFSTEPVAGFAAAAACVADEPAVAVTSAPLDAVTAAIVAETPGLPIEAWGDEVDWSHLAALEAVAGPVTAWPTPSGH